MCVDYANRHHVSTLIEGTWKNAQTVLNEAEICKTIGRQTHAIIIATPPLLSRVGILDRYASNVLIGHDARWTPPQAHDLTVNMLRHNVPLIANSPLIERFSVTDRSGELLFDGTGDLKHTGVAIWHDHFSRNLSLTEFDEIHDVIERAERACGELSAEDAEQLSTVIREVSHAVSKEFLQAESSVITAAQMQNAGRWHQNRDSHGRFSAGGRRF